MALLLFTPILTLIFPNSSLCTFAFSYPCCALCNNSFATFISTMLLLTIAVLRQLLACDSILCATKNCSSVFFSSFSLLSILPLAFSSCWTDFCRFFSFFVLFLLALPFSSLIQQSFCFFFFFLLM